MIVLTITAAIIIAAVAICNKVILRNRFKTLKSKQQEKTKLPLLPSKSPYREIAIVDGYQQTTYVEPPKLNLAAQYRIEAKKVIDEKIDLCIKEIYSLIETAKNNGKMKCSYCLSVRFDNEYAKDRIERALNNDGFAFYIYGSSIEVYWDR